MEADRDFSTREEVVSHWRYEAELLPDNEIHQVEIIEVFRPFQPGDLVAVHMMWCGTRQTMSGGWHFVAICWDNPQECFVESCTRTVWRVELKDVTHES